MGLNDAIFEQVAGIAIVGLADDADDATIADKAKSLGGMLKAFQSETDRRVTEAAKKAGNKGGNNVDPDPNGKKDEKPAWLQEILDAQKAETDALKAKIEALEGVNTKKAFDVMVDGIVKELHLDKLPEIQLGLAKKGLSPDMDETAVRDTLGAIAKSYVDSGFKLDEKSKVSTTSDEDLLKEEQAWVDKNCK